MGSPAPARIPLQSPAGWVWLAIAVLLCHCQSATGDEWVFGMSTALSGPTAELGQEVKIGVEAAFDEANTNGGVRGRALRLIALDDGYDPARTGLNMHRLIEGDRVLAVIGNVGTPTAVVAASIANRSKTLLFGSVSGAGVLRKLPPDRYVVNFRASYREEADLLVAGLIERLGIKPTEVAFFTQRDTYGDAGYVGGITALQRYGLRSETDIAHGRYERNTDAVENGLADILMSYPPPKAVIMVGAHRPCALFIRLARQHGLDAVFLNLSFVGSEPLRQALGVAGEGVIIAQVVPPPESDIPIVQEYRRALAASSRHAIPSYASLEGYLNGRILVLALESINGEIGRETLVDSFEALRRFDIGLGPTLELSQTEHQACHAVWPTAIQGEQLLPLQWSDLDRGDRE